VCVCVCVCVALGGWGLVGAWCKMYVIYELSSKGFFYVLYHPFQRVCVCVVCLCRRQAVLIWSLNLCCVGVSMVVEHLFVQAMKEWMLANGKGHNFLDDVDALHSQHSGNHVLAAPFVFVCFPKSHQANSGTLQLVPQIMAQPQPFLINSVIILTISVDGFF